ncbi:helix-turn-helix transcriptional regulator [Aerophototrophica crusticola]|uniref:Helix-turn-helix transcriptional regulator n=1 Tax=Aerophototrophica crusticola TaxID=1709002 RepID=A0A858R9Q8_9PROT|nr:helix-turn-helix transcriptional regulator [Rhodospirillaceae bacterium B3]
MNAIRPIAVTDNTVTLSRADWDALQEQLEDLHDRATLRRVEADLAAGRTEELPIEMVDRLLAGESPVRVWRDHRGLSQRALAEQAGMGPGYLADIEAGRKPGSADALKRLAAALSVDMGDLVR